MRKGKDVPRRGPIAMLPIPMQYPPPQVVAAERVKLAEYRSQQAQAVVLENALRALDADYTQARGVLQCERTIAIERMRLVYAKKERVLARQFAAQRAAIVKRHRG